MITPVILSWIQFILLFFVAAGIAWAQIRNGSSKVSADTIEAYSKQVELYEKRLGENATTMQDMSSQIGELRGMIASKDLQIEDMRKILENRNPELETILKELSGFMHSVDKRLSEMDAHLKDQDDTLVLVREHQKKPVVVTTEATIGK